MKRSEINEIIKKTEVLARKCGYQLPSFCKWSTLDWQDKGHEYDEIRENMLGWDVTDYGSGNWSKRGMVLITVRNGNLKYSDKYPKVYCEKLGVAIETQDYPLHFHFVKMEDIINRGGGILMVKLYNATSDNKLANTEVIVHSDGHTFKVPAGTEVAMEPGQSVTMMPRTFHSTRVKPGSGEVLFGEVSMVNDDLNDNFFLDAKTRFSSIEEDEEPYHLLCNEYPPAKD